MRTMKTSRLAFVLFLAGLTAAGAADRQIAFERDRAVWTAKIDGSGAKKIADGIFPAISPDGTRVAFNTEEKNGDKWLRHIGVAEIASGKTSVFKDVPSENSYYPSWSPDGAQILFTLRSGDLWDLAVINADGSGFKVVKKAKPNEVTFYSPCWAADGKSIFCEDMTNIYRFGLDGAVLGQWKIDKIISHGDMSGDGRIAVSPNNKCVLLSIEMGEEPNRKDWDGPPPALWSFNLDTQKAVRLTPKTLFGWDGCWIDNDNILFLGQAVGEKSASLYRMRTDGKDRKLLLKDARLPSVNAL
jgi:TolB protein